MAFRSSSSAIAAAGSNSVIINAPAGVQQGDIILLAVECFNAHGFGIIVWPPGFVWLPPTWSTATPDMWACAWKQATSSEPAIYTVISGVNAFRAVAGAWSGRVSSPSLAIGTNGAGGGSSSFPLSLTGYSANALDDVAVFIGVSNPAGSWVVTNSMGYTAQQDNNGGPAGNIGGDLNLSTFDAMSPGATGILTFSATGSGLSAFASGIVIPLPAVPPIPGSNVYYGFDTAEYF